MICDLISIGVKENFPLWCGTELPFLVDVVLAEGQGAYVALHVNFDAAGFTVVTFGNVFAEVVSSTDGPHSCYIFGDTNYPCVDGFEDKLVPIQAPASADTPPGVSSLRSRSSGSS